jgi:hypothetical protein
MPRNESQPVIFSLSNDDGTKEVVAGDFSPFNVIVLSNSGASAIPAECDQYGFYSYGATLPCDAQVEAAR